MASCTVPGEQWPGAHEGSISVSTTGKLCVEEVRLPFQGPREACMCLLVSLKKGPGVLSAHIETDFPRSRWK